ncbi:MAG: hypothetical protein JSS83_14385 [Cyanobacteria bacterium SZAS LIN-3]|nr:hypothetical protein [Cyanobacteria bacterium SZAS LIN-3]
MIYEVPALEDDIRQGDIFLGIPDLNISLKSLSVVNGPEDAQPVIMTWEQLVSGRGQDSASFDNVGVVAAMTLVNAIVITQTCDAVRSPFITLSQIKPLASIDGTFKDLSTAKFVSRLPLQSRQNLKWFYLPPDAVLNSTERLGADFRITIRLQREDLEGLKERRVARLNEVAYEHFRERLADFFRRYAYDEWYSFNKEELVEYKIKNPASQPFKWQE